MAILNPIALCGFIVVIWILYSVFSPRLAMVASLLTGTMFLTNDGYRIPLIRQFDKSSAITLGIFLTMLLVDYARVFKYRLSLVDIPMILWCICPFMSSLSNGLGVYDGLAECVPQLLYWGMPYFIGRVYFTDMHGLSEFAQAFFVAGLILAPFCLIEIQYGPLFHAKVYGFFPHNYWEQYRYNGWRPSVFFIHGLWLGWFMTVATFAGIALLIAQKPRHLWSVPMWLWTSGLLGVTIWCRSTGALVLLFIGIVVLIAGKLRPLFIFVLLCLPLVYVGLRVTQLWQGDQMVSAAENLGEDRASSLSVRLRLEDVIIEKALQQPLFGWGGWGRAERDTRTDRGTQAWTEGVWTMELGRHGLFGVTAWLLSALVPAVVCFRRYKLQLGQLSPTNAGLMVFLIYAPLWLIYGLTVVDFSPYNTVLIGALAGVATAPQSLPTIARVAAPRTRPHALPLASPPISSGKL